MDGEGAEDEPRDDTTSRTDAERALAGAVPFRFACHRCGHCCSGGEGRVWIEDDECDAMARVLSMTTERFVERHVRVVPDPRTGEPRLALREERAGGGRCALLVGRNTCSVYAARPRHCRAFPYWDSVLRDRDAFEAARATCPGIAVVVDAELARRAHSELARLYSELGPARAEGRCCLDDPDRAASTFATGLEADFVLENAGKPEEDALADGVEARTMRCHLGRGAPLACRLDGRAERTEVEVAPDALGPFSSDETTAATPAREGEAWFARVRRIQREHGYPASYGRLDDLLHARGGRHAPSRVPRAAVHDLSADEGTDTVAGMREPTP